MILSDVNPGDASQLNVVPGPFPGAIRVMASPNAGWVGVWVDVDAKQLLAAVQALQTEEAAP